MIRVFFGIENPFGDIIEDCIKDCIVNIQVDKPKTVYDQMREVAEDIEFEEIQTVHENRETETTLQIDK